MEHEHQSDTPSSSALERPKKPEPEPRELEAQVCSLQSIKDDKALPGLSCPKCGGPVTGALGPLRAPDVFCPKCGWLKPSGEPSFPVTYATELAGEVKPMPKFRPELIIVPQDTARELGMSQATLDQLNRYALEHPDEPLPDGRPGQPFVTVTRDVPPGELEQLRRKPEPKLGEPEIPTEDEVKEVVREARRRLAAERSTEPPPETERSSGPGSPAVATGAAPVEDVDLLQLVAGQFGIEAVWLAGLLENIGAKYKLEPEALLDFFGPDGYAVMDEDWWAPVRKQAEATGLELGQLAAADAFDGVAVTLSDRSDFDRLLAAGAGERVSNAFKVTYGTAEQPEFPKTKAERMAQVAELFGIPLERVVGCCQMVCKVRGVQPDEIMAMASDRTLGLLKAHFETVVELDVENRERRIATRSFDWLATQRQVGRFNWEALHTAASVLAVDPGVALVACVFSCAPYELRRAELEAAQRVVPKPEDLLAMVTQPLLVAALDLVELAVASGHCVAASSVKERFVFDWLARQKSEGRFGR